MENEAITGTLDEMEPALRALGFVAVRVMSGPMDLAAFDPYGMRRVGSVNIQTERWAHHVWRGRLVEVQGAWYLTDAERAAPGFVNGLFELLTPDERDAWEAARPLTAEEVERELF